MQKYSDVVLKTNGDVVPGASILVTTSPGGVTATLYSDNGVTVTPNPVIADATGNFAFYAANGRYSTATSGAGIAGTIVKTDCILLQDLTGSAGANVQILSIVPSTANSGAPEIHYGDQLGALTHGWWGSGIDQAATVPYRDYAPVFKGFTFNVNDGVLNGTTTLVSATANFTSAAVGYSVAGAGIPSGTTIASKTNSTTVVMSQAATVSATGVTATFSKTGFSVNDLEYWSHNGFGDPTVGFGLAQPPAAYRMYVQAGTLDATQGTLKLNTATGGNQTGDLIAASTANHDNAFRLKADGSVQIDSPSATAFQVRTNGLTTVFNVDVTGSSAVTTIGNMGVGAGATGTPTATLDVIQTGTADATFNIRTASWGSFRITAKGTTPGTVTLMTQSTVPMVLGTNGATAVTIDTSQNVSFSAILKKKSYAVGSLPAAATAGAGACAFVTDANATTFNSVVAAGGANGVPVFSDGTNWRIG